MLAAKRVAFVLLTLLSLSAFTGEPAFRPGRVIVKMKPGQQVAALNANAKAVKACAGLPNVQVITLPDGADVKQSIANYVASGTVEYAEPDYILSIIDSPNDPSFQNGVLWGLHNTGQDGGIADADIDAPEGWNIQNASPAVIVAVIDTGIRYTHQDLALNMWVNPGEIAGNGIDDDNNGYVDDVYGFNSITGSGNPMDDQGHGTHCAGTIGALGNNNVGVVGVTRSVKLMACKFLDSGGFGDTTDAIECINYARIHGAHVMSNSWGGGGFSQALQDAIAAAEAQGILFVAAAGNSSSNNDDSPNYPSNYPNNNVIAVAATTRTDSMSSFSSYGATTVDLGAPGTDIYSCTYDSDSSYGYKSGTSMATPHVAGACALLKARFPSFTYQQLKARLLDNVDATPAMAGRCLSNGRMNLYKALFSDSVAPTVTVEQAVGQTDPHRGFNVYFTVTFSEPVTGFTPADVVVTGSAAPADVSISGDGPVYTVLLSAIAGAGQLTVNIPAGVVLDLGGNPNTASTSVDNTVTRSFPGILTWTGASLVSNNWSDPANWLGNVAPVAGDNLNFQDSSLRASANNDFPAGTEFGFIGLSNSSGSEFTITGNKAIALSNLGNQGTYNLPISLGQQSAINAIGQVVFNAPLDLNPFADTFRLYPQTGGAIVFNAGVSGNGSIWQQVGTGTTTLNAVCNYAGNTRVDTGTLICGAASVLPATTHVQLLSNAATLNVSAGDQRVQTITGPGQVVASVGTSNRWVTLDTAEYTVFSGQIVGPVNLRKAGSGDLILTTTSSYNSNVEVVAGTLSLPSASGLGSTVGSTTVSGTGSLRLSAGNTYTAEPFFISGTGAGFGAINLSSGTSTIPGPITLTANATVGVSSGSLSLTGNLTGAFSLTKSGAGELVLGGSSAFSSPIQVSEGILNVTGQYQNAQIQLPVFGPHLFGTGQVGSISSSATILPGGLSVGTLEVNGALILGSSSLLQLDVNSAGNQSDRLVVGGNVTLNGSLLLILSGTPAAGATYTIIDKTGSGAVSGTFAGLAEGSVINQNGARLRISYQGGTGNDVVLTALSNPSGISDDFDPTTDATQWSSINGVANTNFAASAPTATGNSVFFDGNVVRQAATVPVNVSTGGTIRFSLIYGSGSFPENADPGEEVTLEYSVNGGTSYTSINTYSTDTYITWTEFTLPIPAGAQSDGTIFRWRQISHSGSGFDHWALDNVLIGSGTAPTISDIANQSGTEDTPLGTIPFTIGDAQTPAALLNVTASSSNTALVSNANITLGGSGANRTILLTPTANQIGSTTITVRVDDGTFQVTDSFVATFVDDNTAPSISVIGNQTLEEDTISPALPFTIGDAQTPASNLTLIVDSTNYALLPPSTIILGGSGANRTVTLKPLQNQFGSATVMIMVSDNGAPDGTPYSTVTSFYVSVVNDNSPPSISSIASFTMQEDTVSPLFNFGVNDAQTPPSALTVSAGTSNPVLIPVSAITLGGSGSQRTLQITPAPNQFGNATITVTVSDNGAPDTTALSTNMSFQVTVLNDNTPPTISAIPNQNGALNAAVGPIPFVVGDAQTPAASLVVSATSSNQTLFPNGSIQVGGIGANRSILLVPANGQSGTATITVQVLDNGAPDAPPGLSATSVFTATVAPGQSVLGTPFRILTLGTSNSSIVDIDNLVGDDRGGIAVSSSSVLVTGDNGTARYDLSNLANGSSLGITRDGLCSDFQNGKAYLLGNGSTPLTYGGGTVTTLLELNPTTGVPNGTVVTLSSSFTASSGSGIFSGYGRIVIHNGANVYNIATPSGVVTNLGAMSNPSHASTENWAYWGIAEYHGGNIHLVYVRDYQTISRTRVPSGTTTVLQSFTNLSDMASITFSPSNNRWYFHHEYGAQFGGNYETLGYADATWDSPVGTPPTITALPDFTMAEDTVLGPLAFGVFDAETPNGLTITAVSSNTALIPNANLLLSGTGVVRNLTATPQPGAIGTTVITLTVSDGVLTATDVFNISVYDDNTTPTLNIASVATVNIHQGAVVLPFTVGDNETPLNSLQISVESTNGLVLPAENIVLGGTGANRTLTLIPNGLTGRVQLTVKVSDNGAPDTAPYSISKTLTAYLHRGAAFVHADTLAFGNTANNTAMDRVFGMGDWAELQFSNADVSRLFSSEFGVVFIDGSEFTASELETFVNVHRTTIELWVQSGGALFLNAAVFTGDGLTAPFGVQISAPITIGTASAVNNAHPIFVGPFNPVQSPTYTGTVAYATISGTGITPLLQEPAQLRTLLAEKLAGAGRVIYGTITPDSFQNPAMNVGNMRANILAYAATSSSLRTIEVSGVPSPTSSGVAQTFSVRILDLFGSVDDAFTGTISFSSTDANAVLPANYTFTAANHGVGHFNLVFATPGIHTLSATSVTNALISGSQSGIDVITNTTPVLSNVQVTNGTIEGGTATLTGSISDPDAGQTFTITALWADGQTQSLALPAGGTAFEIKHLCVDNVQGVVLVTVKDSSIGQTSAQVTYTVLNSKPVPSIVFTGTAFENVAVQLTGTVLDAGTADTHVLQWKVFNSGQEIASGAGSPFQFTPVRDGIYDVTLTATDDDGASGSTTLNITCKGAPKFASGPTATPNPAQPNQPVLLSAVVVDLQALVYAWDFGDGTTEFTLSPTVTHSFSPAGLYPVTLKVTDSEGLTSVKSVVVIVDANGGGALPASEIDSDGDGFSDVMETAAGTSPLNVKSTPMNNLPAPDTLPMVDGKLQIKLNFAKPGQDAIAIAGTLMVDGGFTPAGETVVVDVGGIAAMYTLDSKASFKSKTASFAVRTKLGTSTFQSAKFSWKLKGDFAAEFLDEGLTNTNLLSVSREINVTLLIDQKLFKATQFVKYTAKQGKSGSAK